MRVVSPYYIMGKGTVLPISIITALILYSLDFSVWFNHLGKIILIELVTLLGAEDVNCRMSRCWTRELIGGMVETCIGNMTCKGLRCCRSYCMAMLNLKLLMLSYRLNLVQIHLFKILGACLMCKNHLHIGFDCLSPSYQKELSFDPYKFANWYMDVHGKMAKTYYHLQN
jgi:hypothetical protein